MSRLVPSFAVLLVAASLAAPAFAADWEEEGEWGDEGLRGSTYFNEPKDWSGMGDPADAIGIEAGIRYWYSLGAQNFDLEGDTYATSDTSHIGEVYLRVDDYSSRSYVKGIAGYSMAINGSYDVPSDSGSITGGQIGYFGGDFGWNAIGDDKGSGAGLLAGYQYWNDSPRTARDNYAVIGSAADVGYNEDTGDWTVGVDGVERNLDIHVIRLGVAGRAKLGDMFDITGELVGVPYAKISGQMGGDGAPVSGGPFAGCGVLPPGGCAPTAFRTSALTIDGTAYGGMGELMLGVHPAENLTFRIGARAWYLQGNYDATFTGALVTAPQIQPEIDDPNSADPADTIPPDPLYSAPIVETEDFISTNNPFSMFRYGLLAELTYSF
jgi:hypothetical protein